MKNTNTHGRGDSAAQETIKRGMWAGSPRYNPQEVAGEGSKSAAQRIVEHPDGDGFALLDTFGDYLRSHHGYVMKFTKAAAVKMMGVNEALI